MAGRIHNALSGTELKQAILADIKAALDADSRFEGHLTFPVVTWGWSMDLEAYPVSESLMRVKTSGEIRNEDLIASIKNSSPPVVAIIKGNRKIGQDGQAPDEVRAQTGQPVTVPQKGREDITFETMEGAKKK